jgi:hypothetical protein
MPVAEEMSRVYAQGVGSDQRHRKSNTYTYLFQGLGIVFSYDAYRRHNKKDIRYRCAAALQEFLLRY